LPAPVGNISELHWYVLHAVVTKERVVSLKDVQVVEVEAMDIS
jgi:hypothetical protein